MDSWNYFPVLKETKFKFLDTIWKYVLALKITKTKPFSQDAKGNNITASKGSFFFKFLDAIGNHVPALKITITKTF